ncbi:hypothetical protein [Tepidibacillus marianensis]|uniref:hypothetical protein n=1 Tax=Tepidibacillus marianensis TaxID=3131995 RepID=UPI0030D46053
MSRLDENLGSVAFNNLIHENDPAVLAGHINLAASQGILLRGSVIAMTAAGGNGILLGSDKSVRATLAVTNKVATYEKAGLDTSTLKVYASGSTTPATLTTDYTINYTDGTLTITMTDTGALATATSIDIECDLTVDAMAKAKYILAEDTDTGTGGAVVALAYKAGHFNRNKLIVATGYTMTAANEEELRALGIFLADAYER